MKAALYVILALAFVAAAVALGVWGWIAGGDAQMSGHGWAAMALGVVLSIVVGGGLMALVFYSSRRGYDEGAHYRDDDGEL
jgi:hypothetical protein